MTFYQATKVFINPSSYVNEVVGYFNQYNKALQCSNEGPRYSIDDPSLFNIQISLVSEIPSSWSLKINESIWGKF